MNNEIVQTQEKNYSVSNANIIFESDKMNSIFKIAEMMAKGHSTVPKHLQKNPADCMAIVIQAMQWGMNPFSVAQKTHLVNGVLGYEAQLVNAVIQSSGIIDGSFIYEYEGSGATLACRVGAKIKETGQILYNEFLSVSQVKVKNSPLWSTNPKQQIAYLQVKNWARLYYPSAILGVYTDDELRDYKKPTQIEHVQNKTANAYQDMINQNQEVKKEIEPEKTPLEHFNDILRENGITTKNKRKSFIEHAEIEETDDILNTLVNEKNMLINMIEEFTKSLKKEPVAENNQIPDLDSLNESDLTPNFY